jgi:hypothetical protein
MCCIWASHRRTVKNQQTVEDSRTERHTFDLRFLQLSQAMEVIFPRGVRSA